MRPRLSDRKHRSPDLFRTDRETCATGTLTAVVMFAVITIAVTIPVMIVFNAPPSFAVPITVVITPRFVARRHPTVSAARRPGPIAVMPAVTVSGHVPVTVHPEVVRPWSNRANPNNSRRRRRTNLDSDRHLSGQH